MTAHQGAAGLGLAAQTAAIARCTIERKALLVVSLSEVESGRMNNRAELARSLYLARVTGATLVISRLDQLSRNATFLLALRNSCVGSSPATCPRPTI